MEEVQSKLADYYEVDEIYIIPYAFRLPLIPEDDFNFFVSLISTVGENSDLWSRILQKYDEAPDATMKLLRRGEKLLRNKGELNRRLNGIQTEIRPFLRKRAAYDENKSFQWHLDRILKPQMYHLYGLTASTAEAEIQNFVRTTRAYTKSWKRDSGMYW